MMTRILLDDKSKVLAIVEQINHSIKFGRKFSATIEIVEFYIEPYLDQRCWAE